MEVHFTPAKGGGGTTTINFTTPSPKANPSPHVNNTPRANPATAQPHNAPAANMRSALVHSHQYLYQPITQPPNTLTATANSITIHSRRWTGSSPPPTPARVQTVASTTDATSVDSDVIRVHRHPHAFLFLSNNMQNVDQREHQGGDRRRPHHEGK